MQLFLEQNIFRTTPNFVNKSETLHVDDQKICVLEIIQDKDQSFTFLVSLMIRESNTAL